MNIKYFKYAFITIIILLVIAGIYIIYIRDNNKSNNVQAKTKELEVSKEISIGTTNFDTIDPILTKNLEMVHISKLIYEPLINITKEFNEESAIAEECSKLDELTYLVKLDENKKWTNGDKVKIEDIEFTINTIKKSDSIYNKNVELIERIEKIDENTFKIYLKEPIDFFEYLLCFPIVEEKTYNSGLSMGTGKYKVKNMEKNKIIIKGGETSLTIKIYKNTTELYNNFIKGNIDIIITENMNYEKYIGNIGFEDNIITGREFYYISCENIKEIKTRQIINKNINKEKLVYDLYNKKYIVAKFPLEYGSSFNKENTIDQEEYKVKKQSFTLSTTVENKEIADKIKEQLKEKEILINVENYNNSNSDLVLKTATVPITPEISIYFEDEKTKEELSQIAKIENKEILKQEYGKIIDKYYEELPFISLFFNSYIIIHTNKVKGDFSGNWYNMFYNIDSWYKVI